jgi:ABC-2 type transport system ATP-binding protein
MNYPAIKTEQLTKLYGSFPACVDINLEVQKGDIFAFIGPNGAGKTTTIKIITGILKSTSGRAYVNGIDIAVNPFEAKSIMGYVPDRPFLYEKLTGQEFLDMVREIFKVSRADFDRLADHYIEAFEIKDWMDELIENYSHGMKQKLILISAFAHNPEIFVMDEPLVGLDPKSAKTLKRIIKEQAQRGKTFFISTHILSLVEEICHNLAIIQKGKIILSGNVEEVKRSFTESSQLEDFFLHITEEVRNDT